MKCKFLALVLLMNSFLYSEEISSGRPIIGYVDMVADLFHYGHVNFLRQAKELCDYLIVGIVSDEDVMSYKRKPILTTEERAKSVYGCRYVDKVVANCPLCVTEDFIREHNIDIVIHGDDFDTEKLNKFYSAPIKMGIFRAIKYTDGISTTDLIRRVKEHK